MTEGLIRQLLEAGVHFGHQTKKWNPKMAQYIFGQKKGIYIIDLQKTQEAIQKACDFLRDTVKEGGTVLLVGTKKQAQEVIAEQAKKCEMFYVTQRWLGGMLTNFATVRKSVDRLKELYKMKEEGVFGVLSKKEVASLEKEIMKLEKNLGGILEMDKLPSAIFVIDPKKEEIVINEAKKLGIDVVALIDTNCNPEVVSYPIPGNDDAIRSIKLITTIVADAVLEGRKMYDKEAPKREKEEAKKKKELEAASKDRAKEEIAKPKRKTRTTKGRKE